MLAALTTTNQKKIKTKEFNFSLSKSEKWDIDTSNLSEQDKNNLLDDGFAENLFKVHINQIKNAYKNKKNDIGLELEKFGYGS